jgi:hypothetical protein
MNPIVSRSLAGFFDSSALASNKGRAAAAVAAPWRKVRRETAREDTSMAVLDSGKRALTATLMKKEYRVVRCKQAECGDESMDAADDPSLKIYYHYRKY